MFMTKPELFMLLRGIKKHIEMKQWDAVEEIVDDTTWAVADKDWRAANKDLLTKHKKTKD
jgi:hypothetical protein